MIHLAHIGTCGPLGHRRGRPALRGGGFLGVRLPASQDPGAALVFAGRLAGKASEAAVAALVAQAVQVVVQVEDGAVVGIHEITGVEDGQVSTQPLFLFQGGSLVSTGASPSF